MPRYLQNVLKLCLWDDVFFDELLQSSPRLRHAAPFLHLRVSWLDTCWTCGTRRCASELKMALHPKWIFSIELFGRIYANLQFFPTKTMGWLEHPKPGVLHCQHGQWGLEALIPWWLRAGSCTTSNPEERKHGKQLEIPCDKLGICGGLFHGKFSHIHSLQRWSGPVTLLLAPGTLLRGSYMFILTVCRVPFPKKTCKVPNWLSWPSARQIAQHSMTALLVPLTNWHCPENFFALPHFVVDF